MKCETEPALIQNPPVLESSILADQFPEIGREPFNLSPEELEQAWGLQ